MYGRIDPKLPTFSVFLWYAVLLFCFADQGAFFIGGAAVLTAWMLLCVWALPARVRTDLVFWGLFAVFALALCSFVFAAFDRGSVFGDLLKYALLPLSYLYFCNTDRRKTVENVFFCGIVLLACFGLLGYVSADAGGMLTDKGERLQSLFQYANTTALFLAVGILLSADRFRRGKKIRYLFFAGLFALALYRTQTRGAIYLLAAIALLYILFLLRGRARLLAFGGLAVLALAVLLLGGRITELSPLTDRGLITRLLSDRDAAAEIGKHPLFGLGFGSWQYVQYGFQTAPYKIAYLHCHILQIGADAGLFAALLFLAVTVYGAIRALRVRGVWGLIFLYCAAYGILEIHFAFGVYQVFFAFVLSALTAPQKAGAETESAPESAARLRLAARRALIAVCLCTLLLPGLSGFFAFAGDRARTREDAEANYQTAIRLFPQDSRLYEKLGDCREDPERALEAYREAFARNPMRLMMRVQMCKCLLKMGEAEEALALAIESYERASLQGWCRYYYQRSLEACRDSGIFDEDTFERKLQDYRDDYTQKAQRISPLYQKIS